jgi:protein involved in polysaccharide export with SLBB domain
MFSRGPCRRDLLATLLVVLTSCAGCSLFRQTIPANCFPGIAAHPRADKQPIDYALLRQEPPAVYQLGPGDILGIYVEAILPPAKEKEREVPPPPVHLDPQRIESRGTMGYPFEVSGDGEVWPPLLPEPVKVTGLTVPQAEEEIRKAYAERRLTRPGAQVIVSLIDKRRYNVIVIREDGIGPEGRPLEVRSQQFLPTGAILEPPKLGIAKSVELKAYENDVLHALAQSGGLPGTAAKAEIKILRGAFRNARERDQYLRTLEDPALRAEIAATNQRITRIPLRIGPGEPMPRITREDILLHDGDIVYIESREQETFYTGGLLRGGQFPIPRDYDLDVLGAVAMSGGSIAAVAGGSGGGPGGRGSAAGIFPPTRVIVLRTVEGRQVAIQVDLKRTMTDPSERILIQPNDFIVLEYTPTEVVLNMILNNLSVSLSLNDMFK